jgi:hypothetical protein
MKLVTIPFGGEHQFTMLHEQEITMKDKLQTSHEISKIE